MAHSQFGFAAGKVGSIRRGLTLLELLVVLVILLALSTLVIPTIGWLGERSQEVATLENLHRLRELLTNQYMVDMGGELPRPPAGDAVREPHPQMLFLFVNPDTYGGDSWDDWGTSLTQPNARPTTALSGRNWNGPYMQHSGSQYFVTDTSTDGSGSGFTNRYGEGVVTDRNGDPTVVDAWSNPIVIQQPYIEEIEEELDGLNLSDSQKAEFARRHARLVSAGRDGIINTPPGVAMPTKEQRNDDLVLFLFRHDDYGDELLELDNE